MNKYNGQHAEIKPKTWKELEYNIMNAVCPPNKWEYNYFISYKESIECEIEKVKDMDQLHEIILYLKGYNTSYNTNKYMRSYLDERISTYEKELSEYEKSKIVETLDQVIKNVESEESTSSVKSKKKNNGPPKKRIPSTLKRLVWNTHVGEDIGKTKCLCCKCTDITQMSFHCGHIISEVNGGELVLSNLKPICQNCNSSMGTKNMNDFMDSFK